MSHTLHQRSTIMVVDDTPANLSLFNQALKGLYRVKIATCGSKALQLARLKPPDLIILDVVMPGMDGFEVCKRLKADAITAKIPVILSTAPMTVAEERRGFESGAVDYIQKPLSFAIVQNRVKNHLQIRDWQNFLQNQNTWIQEEVNRRVRQVFQLQTATIQVMVSLAEFRDEETGNHIRRTQEYVRILGQRLLQYDHMYPELNATVVEQMAQAATLHDIGKIAIPDHILLKPSTLTAQESAIMKTHTTRGCEILEQIHEDLGEDNPLLSYSSSITRHHHEHWDGHGYPDGLIGDAIPLAARLMAIADVYDASRCVRAYKKALTHEQSLELIAHGSGSQFDPKLAEAFLALEAEVCSIANRFADP